MANKWSAVHYNALAKEIREHFPLGDFSPSSTIIRTFISDFSVSLAKRFEEDNERFDPVRFLDACSPNPDLYPLSELWNEGEK